MQFYNCLHQAVPSQPKSSLFFITAYMVQCARHLEKYPSGNTATIDEHTGVCICHQSHLCSHNCLHGTMCKGI